MIGGAPRGRSRPVARRGAGDAARRDPGPAAARGHRARGAERRASGCRSSGPARDAQAEKPDFLGEPATLDADGLVLAPGAGPVLERVENPMGYTAAQGQSLGIRVMFEGREKYSLLTRNPTGAPRWARTTPPGTSPGGSRAGSRASATSTSPTGSSTAHPLAPETDPSNWLRLQGDGSVVGASGVVVLEVDADPDLGDFALGADRTGAVRVLVDERARFAAYRVINGELEVVAAPGSSTP